VTYLKQKLAQSEERITRERARLDAERRELDDMRRNQQTEGSHDAWTQLLAARADLHALRSAHDALQSAHAANVSDLELTRDQLEASRAAVSRLHEAISALETDLDNLHAQRREDLSGAADTRRSLEASAARASDALHSASAERDALRTEVSHLSALLQSAIEASGKEGAAVARVVREFGELREENAALGERLRTLVKERDEAVAHEAEVRANGSVEQAALRHEREALERNRDAALADLAEMRAASDALSRELTRARNETRDANAAAAQVSGEVITLRNQLEAARESARLDKEQSVNLTRFKELQELLTQSKAESAGLAEELRGHRAQFAAFRAQAVARDQALRAELETERARVKDLYRSDREEIEAERRAVREERDSLAARLDAALDKCARERREDAAELARSQAALERLTELAASEKRQMADAFAAERESLQRALAELEGRISDRDRSLATAREAHDAAQRFLAEITQLQRDNEQLANEAQRSERQCAALRQQLQHSAEQVYTHSEAALLKAQEDARSSAQEAMLQTEIAKRREVQRLRLDLERAVVAARDEKHAAIEQARVQFEERLQTAEAERRRALARAQQDLDDLRKENYTLREELHALRMDRDDLDRLFRDTDAGTPYSLIDQNARLRAENADLTRRHAHLESANATLSSDRDAALSAARADLRARGKEIIDLETQLTLATIGDRNNDAADADATERVARARKTLKAARSGAREADALETENVRLRAELARLGENRAVNRTAEGSAAREQLAVARNELDALRAKLTRVREEYEFARGEAEELRGRLAAREAQARAASAASSDGGDRRRRGGSSSSASAISTGERAELEDLRRENGAIHTEVAKLRAAIAEHRHEAQHATRQAETLEIQARQCEEELARTAGQLRRVSEDLAKSDEQCKRMKRELLDAGKDPRGPINRDTDADVMDRRELARDRERLEGVVADLKARLELAELKARNGGGGASSSSAAAFGGAGEIGAPTTAVSGRASSGHELSVERDMDRMRALTGPERARAKENLRGGRPLFDDDNHAREVSAEMREFEAMQEKLHELWRLRVELQNSTIERLNPKQSRRDGVKELLETSNSKIDGVLGQIRRHRKATRFAEGDLFDHVSQLLIENGESYKKVNSYSEALLGATLSKLARLKRDQGVDDGSVPSPQGEQRFRSDPAGAGSRAPRTAGGVGAQQRALQQQQPPQQPKEEPGFFASLFGLADEEENTDPKPARQQAPPANTNSRARSRFA
jgi:chromosome segregation ATPase